MPILWALVLMSGSLGCWVGSGNVQAQESPTILISEAEVDSLTQAFFLLKYDYDVLYAKSEADSMVFAQRISDIRAGYSRQILVVGVTALVTGLLFYAGSQIE